MDYERHYVSDPERLCVMIYDPVDNHRAAIAGVDRYFGGYYHVSDAGNPYTNTWVSNICLLRGTEKNVISDEMKLLHDIKCSMF